MNFMINQFENSMEIKDGDNYTVQNFLINYANKRA